MGAIKDYQLLLGASLPNQFRTFE